VEVVLQGESTTVKGQKEISTPGSAVRDMVINQDREGEEEVVVMETSTDNP